MMLELNLSPELQARLQEEADRRGESIDSVVVRLLDARLPHVMDERRRDAALAMLRQWVEEDANMTPEEAAANEEFLRNLDANRTPNRPLYPLELKGITW